LEAGEVVDAIARLAAALAVTGARIDNAVAVGVGDETSARAVALDVVTTGTSGGADLEHVAAAILVRARVVAAGLLGEVEARVAVAVHLLAVDGQAVAIGAAATIVGSIARVHASLLVAVSDTTAERESRAFADSLVFIDRLAGGALVAVGVVVEAAVLLALAVFGVVRVLGVERMHVHVAEELRSVAVKVGPARAVVVAHSALAGASTHDIAMQRAALEVVVALVGGDGRDNGSGGGGNARGGERRGNVGRIDTSWLIARRSLQTGTLGVSGASAREIGTSG